MKIVKQNNTTGKADFPGYPLTDFLDESAFQNALSVWQKTSVATRVSDMVTIVNPSIVVPTGNVFVEQGTSATANPTLIYEDLHQLLKGVYLCKFKSKVAKGKLDYYIYDVGLNSEKTIGFLLQNPLDTIITFGKEKTTTSETHTPPSISNINQYWHEMAWSILSRKAGKTTHVKIKHTREPKPDKRPQKKHDPLCDLNLRFVVNQKNVLEVLHIYGPDIEIFFSKGLVKPVRKNEHGKYEPTGRRQNVKLGSRLITIVRGMPPKLSGPLTFDDNLVQISGQNIIVRLKKVDLGGTFQEPKLIFTDVELME